MQQETPAAGNNIHGNHADELSNAPESCGDTVQAPDPSTPSTRQTQGSPSTSLGGLMSLQEFIDTKEGRRLFASTDSMRWFIRSNIQALLRAGAIVKMGRRTLISRPSFDDAVVDIVRRRAREQMAQ